MQFYRLRHVNSYVLLCLPTLGNLGLGTMAATYPWPRIPLIQVCWGSSAQQHCRCFLSPHKPTLAISGLQGWENLPSENILLSHIVHAALIPDWRQCLDITHNHTQHQGLCRVLPSSFPLRPVFKKFLNFMLLFTLFWHYNGSNIWTFWLERDLRLRSSATLWVLVRLVMEVLALSSMELFTVLILSSVLTDLGHPHELCLDTLQVSFQSIMLLIAVDLATITCLTTWVGLLPVWICWMTFWQTSAIAKELRYDSPQVCCFFQNWLKTESQNFDEKQQFGQGQTFQRY